MLEIVSAWRQWFVLWHNRLICYFLQGNFYEDELYSCPSGVCTVCICLHLIHWTRSLNSSKINSVVREVKYFTFTLPCIVINFLLNNQPDALTTPILFCYKTLHVSGIFPAHNQEFSTVHSALVSFMHFSNDRFQAESWLCLEAVIRNLHETYQCRIYSRKLLIMGREDAGNM